LKNELRDVFFGKSQTGQGNLVQTVARYLGRGQSPSAAAQEVEFSKSEERARLEAYVDGGNLWLPHPDPKNYIAEGAEQRVFLSETGTHVIKLNSSVFYASWEDYLNSLLLHNFFFPDTRYELLGFCKYDNELHSVVRQPFVIADQITDLTVLKTFLHANGFRNTRNEDYRNEALGIILEDMHDENVLMRQGVLFVIDSVFYLTDKFRKSFA
jgi:hypothetical protein